MNKYQLVNGKWVVTKTAQTYDKPSGFWEGVGNTFSGAYNAIFQGGGDGTALNNLNLKDATALMNYVYGPAPFGGWGPWGEDIEKSKEQLSYLDADYAANIDGLKEDFDEVRQKNIDALSALQRATTGFSRPYAGMRGMRGMRAGSPGASAAGGRRGIPTTLTLD